MGMRKKMKIRNFEGLMRCVISWILTHADDRMHAPHMPLADFGCRKRVIGALKKTADAVYG
jgi:hypothetical protein